MTKAFKQNQQEMKAYRQLIQSKILQCQFQEAAHEVLRMSARAVWFRDKTDALNWKRELIEVHQVDWKKAVREFSV